MLHNQSENFYYSIYPFFFFILFFCVCYQHGGLFTKLNVTLEDIKRINRFNEPGEEGGETLMAQMLVCYLK
jgi:hypothetical protein